MSVGQVWTASAVAKTGSDRLDESPTRCGQHGWRACAGLSSLKWLTMTGAHVTDGELAARRGLYQTGVLGLNGNDLPVEGLQLLRRCRS